MGKERCRGQVVSDEDVEYLVPSSKTLVLTSPFPPIHPKNSGISSTACSDDTFENYLEESERFSPAQEKTRRRLAYLVILSLCSALFLPSTYTCAILAFTLILIVYKRRTLCPILFKKNDQVRILKWNIEEFEEKIKSGCVSSPVFKASCCQWRLLVNKKTTYSKYCIGLILTNISPNVKLLHVKTQVGVSKSDGKDLIPELKELCLSACFESNGDCGFSDYFSLEPCTVVGGNGSLAIKCRMEINSEALGLTEKIMARLSPAYKLEEIKKGPNQVFEVGIISPQQQESQRLTVGGFEEIQKSSGREFRQDGGVKAFLQHQHTKVFLWKIPNGFQLLENGGIEIRDFFSPSFILDSHGLVSIWRMKLLELHGVLRLHLQLRGLGKRTSQVKIRYTVEIRDTFGDFVLPEQSTTTAKYADYLGLWGTTRMPLYSSSALKKRFVTPDAGINLRVSLQVEPLETDIIYPTD